MKIVICDDEKIFCEILSEKCRELLTKQQIVYEEEVYTSGADLLREAVTPDILLLDIDMPGMDGIEVAEQICRLYPDCFIIFITSHYDKARLGYRVNAHRFLLKPVDGEELEEAFDTAMQKLNEQKMLILDEKGIERFLKVSDIVYIEALGFGSVIYTRDEHYVSKKIFNYFIKQLMDEGFFQVHKCFMVSMAHVVEITNKPSVIMDNGVEVSLSRRKKAELKEQMIEYVKKHAI